MSTSHQSSLIFLISQPRAGSTLLQRILGSHAEIHTVSEPWVLLHPLYALRAAGYEAEYNAALSRRALKNFLQCHPEGEAAYFQAVGQMYTSLYGQILSTVDKRYFLDKTPRYYYIIDEIKRTFPDAALIFLVRNPLSVLCSICETWIHEDWYKLHRYRDDLLRAPSLLLDGIETLADQGLAVHYEQLLLEPQQTIAHICRYLKIDFDPAIVDYGNFAATNWDFGDHDSLQSHHRPEPDHAEQWIARLQNPQIWQLADDYLRFLGESIVTRMGYSYAALAEILEAHRPAGVLPQGFLFQALERFEGPKIDQTKQDVAFLQALIQQHPEDGEAYRDLGAVLLQNGDLEEAIEHLQHAVRLNAGGSAYVLLGQAYLRQDNCPEAAKVLQIALEQEPDSYAAHEKLGWVRLKMDQPEQALEYFNRAVALNPDYFQAYQGLGRVLLRQKQFAQAATAFERAIALNPKFFQAYEGLGRALFHQKNFAAAVDYLQRALEISPTHQPAINLLAQIETVVQ